MRETKIMRERMRNRKNDFFYLNRSNRKKIKHIHSFCSLFAPTSVVVGVGRVQGQVHLDLEITR